MKKFSKISISVLDGEYIIADAKGKTRLVSMDIIKIYTEIVLLTDNKLKSGCLITDVGIKTDLYTIDEIVKSSKRFLKNSKKKTVPLKRSTRIAKPINDEERLIEICKLSNGYFRKYIKDNHSIKAIVTHKVDNIKLPNGKTSWQYSLWTGVSNVSSAKSLISAALPKISGTPQAFAKIPLVWLV